MVLNMDTELQRLICVSVEKMTREPGSGGRGLPGNSSRKSRGLDLRKALLVAHVLEDMRSAYISDDYQVLVNTVCPELRISSDMEELRSDLLRKEYQELSNGVISSKKRRFITDEWSDGSIERPPRSEACPSTMASQYRCPSGTQSCVMTCSDARMSKISQITHPIPVSINTTYVLSHQTSDKDCDVTEDKVMDVDCDDMPAVSEQVEVTSSNDVETESVEAESVQLDNVEIVSTIITSNSNEEKTTVTSEKNEQCTNSDKSQGITKSSISCPLPRKKRPLPKEFLEQGDVTVAEKECKRTKVDTTVTSSACGTVTSSCYIMNTTTATTLTQSTALSKSNIISFKPTSQSVTCSTVTSSVCTTHVSSSTSSSTEQSGPRVVVEKNMQPSFHTLWSWTLPATCTRPKMSHWLMDGVYRTQMSEISKLHESSIHNNNLGLVAY